MLLHLNNMLRRIVIASLSVLMTVAANGMSGRLYEYDKLTNSLVTRVCQDKYGYVWIASNFGLNRFDGYRFVHYYHISDDSTSISDNHICSLLSTREGGMFVGSCKGLSRYDYETDTFHRYHFPNNVTPRVNSLVELESGNVLVGTAGYGVFILDKGKDQLRAEDSFTALAKNNYLSEFCIDKRRRLWGVTNDKRVVSFGMKGEKATDIQNYTIGGITPVKLLIDPVGNPLFVMANSILKYDLKTDAIVASGYEIPENVRIASAQFGKDENLYLGVIGAGLYIIKKGETKAEYEQLLNNHYQMSGIVVNGIMMDKDDNLWLTIPHYGVYKSSGAKRKFWSFDFSVNGKHHAYGFTSIIPDDNGGVYCIARHKGLYDISVDGTYTKCEGVPDDCSTVFRDSKGQMWVGTWRSLYMYDPQGKSCRMFNDLGGNGTPFITEDKTGNLYLSVFGNGFAVCNTNTGAMKYFNSRTTAKDKVKFANDWVGMMYCDKGGKMWITTSSGVWCFDPVKQKFVDLGNNDGILRDLGCNSIAELKDGNIVIGTVEGVYVYDRKQRKAMLLPGSDAIKDMKISGLLADENGDVWISTCKGMWQYNHSSQRLVSYSANSEITDNEFSEGAFCRLADGMVVFGSNSNLTGFYPKQLRNSQKIDGEIYLTRFATTTTVGNPFADSFVIPWDDNRFTMEFSMLNFKNTDAISYEYRINGGKWMPFEHEGNSLTFTKLASGTYTIEVRVTANGLYSDYIKRLTVEVEAPWYATWIAIMIYCIVALLVLGYIGIGVRRRQKARFEEEKMKLLINATHDIRSPLTLILGPLSNLKTLLGKVADEGLSKEMGGYLNVIDRNAQRLLLLVNQILDMRKIDKQQMKLKCKETDMVEFVERACKLFEYNAKQNGYDFTYVHPEDTKVMAWIDRLNFDKVFNNLLSNAFKYTSEEGEVKVELTQTTDTLTIKVIDSGVGISEVKPSRLFDRFYQGAANDITGIPGTGIGLNLARNIVEMHGGTISAGNRSDGVNGACFTVTLPLGKDHLKPEDIYEPETDELAAKKIISRKCKVAIVDDDEELAAYTARELRQWYHVDVFNDADSAFKVLLDDGYDIVVSDVVMPGTDGIAFLKKIKSNPKTNHTPVILLTTKSEVEDLLAGIKSGADAYMAKPFSCDMLHARIDNLVDNMRRMRGKFSGSQQQHDKVEQVEVVGYDDIMMKKVMKSVNEHISDCDYSVDVLSEEVGMSRAQLHRKIKEITGLSTGKFIRNIRMDQAGRLIKEGKVNVTDVAYRVGFNDKSYFSTVFKQYYGVSPLEYSKK